MALPRERGLSSCEISSSVSRMRAAVGLSSFLIALSAVFDSSIFQATVLPYFVQGVGFKSSRPPVFHLA